MRRFAAPVIAAIIALSAVAAVAQGNRVAVVIPASSEILASCAGGIVYVTPEGAARVVGCSNPATATATVPPTASMTPGPTNTAGPSSTPTITPTPDALWWLAGGVDPADVVGAWRAKGAASYGASIDSLSGGPDLYAPQSQPTWTAAKGWQGGQGRHLAMTGGVFPAYGWTYIMKHRNAPIGSQQFMGCKNVWGDRTTGMDINNTGGFMENSTFNALDVGGVVLTGTMALAGPKFYVDGIRRGPEAVPGTGRACTVEAFILTANWGGVPHGGGLQTEVQGVAIYSDTLTAGQAAAIATAVGGW
jgi:hypothetical protein